MGENEQRHLTRDSLFVLARLRLDGRDCDERIKVRNLSPGGLMAEGAMRVVVGMPVEVEVRSVGWVPGVVAWVQDNRFGIAFAEEIDPKAARLSPSSPADDPDYYARRSLTAAARALAPDPRQLRKI